MKNILGVLVILLLLFSLVVSPSPVHAASFTVITTNDSGAGSLRQAILDANASPGTDTIEFNIPSVGPHTIQPLSALPIITEPVIIDGYTQPGASPNTNGPGLRINAVLMIELDGSMAGEATWGLNISAGNSTIRGLVINRFRPGGCFDASGIQLRFNGDNVIEGNFIGTDVTGTVDLGNCGGGVDVYSSPNNTIGGSTADARNIISGNDRFGIRIFGSTGNTVQGNLIGTDVTGTTAVGNGKGASIEAASNNTVGGTDPGAGNVISGNSIGLHIYLGSATGNTVQGNLIGTDVTGIVAIGNGTGVFIERGSNTIGGTVPGAGNVISGNTMEGIHIYGKSTTGNLVQGNLIGTEITGTASIGNRNGVMIHYTSGHIIGGTMPIAGNVISGNNNVGVLIYNASENLIQGNSIGTDVTGTLSNGNSGNGVETDGWSGNNAIGGTTNVAGNIIAFNGGDGVSVTYPFDIGNAILSNSIFSNAGLGIDLSPDGVTPNDVGDADTGANNLQNFPILTSSTSGSSTTIEGTLNSTPDTVFRLEFFSNTASDPTGYGEGENFLGSTDVTTNVTGDTTFAVTFPTAVPAGQFVSATATDPNNNTSEFSGCIEVIAEVQPVEVTVDFAPDTLNKKSKGKWVTAYIELEVGYDVNDIDVGAVLLNDTVPAEPKPVTIGDYDSDGVPDLMVKFDRAAVQELLTAGNEVEVIVSGELTDDTPFEGTDTIRVIEKGKK